MSSYLYIGRVKDSLSHVGVDVDYYDGARNAESTVNLGVYGEDALALLSEAQTIVLIKLLKEAKRLAWPKPLKPLCPSSAELLKYLQRYDGITPLKAREELGIEHLPRRIKDLKEHGYQITAVRKRGYAGKVYGHYSLESRSGPAD